MMKKIVLHVSGKELDDVLVFNRLRADIKKIIQNNRLILVHDAAYQFEQTLLRRGKTLALNTPLDDEHLSLKQDVLNNLNKTLAAKLSEDLVPALPIAAHHLGLVREAIVGESKTLVVKIATLQDLMNRDVLPVIAPIVKNSDGKFVDAQSELVAAKLAAGIHADILIFLSEQKTPNAATRQVATQSLVEGAKRAFITDLNGMEKILLREELAEIEIFV